MTSTQVLICPYCGETQSTGERCRVCGGFFEPLSRQATQNQMGPWFIRDPARPFRPGCSYETLHRMIQRGQVTTSTILRGPTTKQFWTIARRTPGVAHLLGYCHQCDASVNPADTGCPSCGAPFNAPAQRDTLGLAEFKPLPDEPRQEAQAAGVPQEAGAESAATPAALGRGLSSFATDEELIGASGHSGSPSERRDTGPLAEAPPPTPHPVGVADAEPVRDTPVIRSMQRRLDRQQWTIRWLAILVIIVAVAAAVVHVAALTAMRRHVSLPPDTSDVAPPPSPIIEPAPGIGPPVTPADEQSLPEDHVQLEEPPLEIQPPAMTGAYEAEYDRAVLLMEHAADPQRPAEDRLRDYREALLVMQNIDQQVSADDQPDDLHHRISAIEAAIEQIELNQYFQ